MDNQMILQMMQNFLPPAFQEVMELQQLILSHANKGGDNWRIEMLQAIRPKLPESNRHRVDILIKFIELYRLLEKGCEDHGHKCAVQA